MARSPIARYYAFRVTQSAAFTLPIFAVFFQSRGLSLAAIGLVEAAYTVVTILAETPTGYVGDRLGRRRTLLVAATLAGVGAIGFAFAHSLPAFLAVIVVRAVSGAFRSGTGEAWLYELLHDRDGLDSDSFAHYRGRAGALARVTTGVSVLVGGLLYAADPVAPWFLEGGVVLAGGLLALSLPEPPRTAEEGPGEDEPGPLAALRAARTTLVRPGVRRFVLYTGLLFAVVAGAHVVVQPVAVGLAGVAPAHLGVLYAGMVTAAAVAAERSGWIRERVGIDRWFTAVVPALGVLALGVLLLPRVVLAVFVCLWAVRAASGPMVGQYLNDRSGSSARATTLSAAAMVRRLLSAPTKLVVGAVAGHSLAGAVAGLGGVLVVGALVAFAVGGPIAVRDRQSEVDAAVDP